MRSFQAGVSKQVSMETACCNSARNSKTQVSAAPVSAQVSAVQAVRIALVRKPVRMESAIYSGLPKGQKSTTVGW